MTGVKKKYFLNQKDKEKGLKPGQLYWELLKVIGATLFIGSGSIYRPILPIALEEIIRIIREINKVNIQEESIRESLKNLEKKEIVNLIEKEGKVFVCLKDYKNPYVLKYSIKSLLDFKRKNKKWDKKWFLVFFDVPEIQRNKRDYLRKFLVQIGFYRFQKSVYLFPYECEKEVALIKRIIEGAKYMKYIVAEKIEDEDLAKTYFHLN